MQDADERFRITLLAGESKSDLKNEFETRYGVDSEIEGNHLFIKVGDIEAVIQQANIEEETFREIIQGDIDRAIESLFSLNDDGQLTMQLLYDYNKKTLPYLLNEFPDEMSGLRNRFETKFNSELDKLELKITSTATENRTQSAPSTSSSNSILSEEQRDEIRGLSQTHSAGAIANLLYPLIKGKFPGETTVSIEDVEKYIPRFKELIDRGVREVVMRCINKLFSDNPQVGNQSPVEINRTRPSSKPSRDMIRIKALTKTGQKQLNNGIRLLQSNKHDQALSLFNAALETFNQLLPLLSERSEKADCREQIRTLNDLIASTKEQGQQATSRQVRHPVENGPSVLAGISLPNRKLIEVSKLYRIAISNNSS